MDIVGELVSELAELFDRINIEKKDETDFKQKLNAKLGPERSKAFFEDFLKLETVDQMFSHFWELPEAHECLIPPEVKFEGKTEEAAEHIRTTGNKFYKAGVLDPALKCYSLSITLAPHPKLPEPDFSNGNESKYKSLACAYANRSAVHLRMKNYKQCLIDIDLALKYGYSSMLKDKLLDRKERCLKAQRQERLKPLQDDIPVTRLNAKTPPVVTEPNPTIPSFSSALKVAYSQERGRHVVATRDIVPGEVLAVDSGYSSLIYFNESMFEACPVCLMKCQESLVPCPECMVVFCSESCREKGLAGVHGKECKLVIPLMQMNISDLSLFALRVILQTTFKTLKEKLPVLQKEAKNLSPEKLGFDENGIYNTQDYRAVYHMGTLEKPYSSETLFNTCHEIFVLTKMLTESNSFFFDYCGKAYIPSREDLLAVGSSLLFHASRRSNMYAVTDCSITKVIGLCTETIGFSIFPAVWLLNHSCNSNAAHYNIGPKRIVRSVMTISAGEEVTVSLSEGFQKLPYIMRQLKLSLIGIFCNCEACEDNWPTLDELPNEHLFKCPRCSNVVIDEGRKFACVMCNFRFAKTHYKGRMKSAVEKFWSGYKEVKELEIKCSLVALKVFEGVSINRDDFDVVCHYISAIQRNCMIPSRALCLTREILLRLFFLTRD